MEQKNLTKLFIISVTFSFYSMFSYLLIKTYECLKKKEIKKRHDMYWKNPICDAISLHNLLFLSFYWFLFLFSLSSSMFDANKCILRKCIMKFYSNWFVCIAIGLNSLKLLWKHYSGYCVKKFFFFICTLL